jgi:hypothetical protein
MALSPRQPSSSQRSNWIIPLVVLGAAGSCGLVLLPVGVYALRSHLLRTSVAETQQSMGLLAAGVAQCVAQSRSGRIPLPPTAQPVPRALASVSGRKYQSRTLDWQDEAYQCARFALSMPQVAQLQWIRSSDSEGYVRGILDLDGDMVVEVILEQGVKCKNELCTPGEIIQKR